MTDVERHDTGAGPFGRAARLYRSAGWSGTLPVGRGPNQKSPPPSGWTGHGAPYPSDADVGAWEAGAEAGFNIGVRMPLGIVGLDVDAGYGGKTGDETLATLEAKYGPLPPTWVSSARPAPSGIRFFRVPELLDGRPINWPGEAGKFIEIIQPGHRYAVVWPSTNPDAAGAPYEWRAPLGDLRPDDAPMPPPDELPWMPEAWVRGLALPYATAEKSDLGDAQLATWWDGLRTDLPPCPLIHSVWTRAVHELRAADGARHETARGALAAAVRAGGEGHRGAPDAVAQIGAAFREAVGAERADGGEWQRLVSGAVKLAAADNPRPRTVCAHDAPPPATALAVPEGFTVPGVERTSDVSGATAGTLTSTSTLTLPDAFWRSRESLSRIRQAAHARVRSADVVFLGLLCRLSAMVPHTLRADTGIGQPASLNLFAAIVGPSGGGKSSGLSVSRELIKSVRPLNEYPLGSGEGIAEAYMGEALEGTGVMAKDGSEKQAKVRKQISHAALFHSDEGASLNKMIERAGSTVGETLRSAWSGEAIGQKNGRSDTTRTIPARSYSAGLVIGYQPSTALPLLADYEAGTPQRFLYGWAVDPTIPPRSARVPWPGEITSPFPADTPTDLPAAGAIVAGPPTVNLSPIAFAEEILDELYDTEHAKSTGTLPAGHWLLAPGSLELDPYKSQHTVLKVKVAALLALLEGRRNVTLVDWDLAQIVIDTSDAVRRYLAALAEVAAGKARAAFLAAEAEAEHFRAHAREAVTAALDLTAETRVAVRMAQRVHDGEPMTLGALRKTLAGRDKRLAEAALDVAMRAGWVAVAEGGRVFGPGTARPV